MKKLQERLAKLAGRVPVIRVGGATEGRSEGKKDRVDGATHATRAAVEEGIVPGGGVAFLAAAALDGLTPEDNDQKVGIDIVKHALQSPVRQVVENSERAFPSKFSYFRALGFRWRRFCRRLCVRHVTPLLDFLRLLGHILDLARRSAKAALTASTACLRRSSNVIFASICPTVSTLVSMAASLAWMYGAAATAMRSRRSGSAVSSGPRQ